MGDAVHLVVVAVINQEISHLVEDKRVADISKGTGRLEASASFANLTRVLDESDDAFCSDIRVFPSRAIGKARTRVDDGVEVAIKLGEITVEKATDASLHEQSHGMRGALFFIQGNGKQQTRQGKDESPCNDCFFARIVATFQVASNDYKDLSKVRMQVLTPREVVENGSRGEKDLID